MDNKFLRQMFGLTLVVLLVGCNGAQVEPTIVPWPTPPQLDGTHWHLTCGECFDEEYYLLLQPEGKIETLFPVHEAKDHHTWEIEGVFRGYELTFRFHGFRFEGRPSDDNATISGRVRIQSGKTYSYHDWSAHIVTDTLTIPTPPTPTPGVDSMLASTAKLCEGSFSGRPIPTGRTLNGKILVLINEVYEENVWKIKEWTRYPNVRIEDIEAHTPSEVTALVCVRETRERVGAYTDGEGAYKAQWHIGIVSWPDGRVIASNLFEGRDPPSTKGYGPGVGYPSNSKFNEWLASFQ